MSTPAELYRGHRFPADIISQVVWLYFRFSLSYRDVEEMMARRGIQLTYETVREWCAKFGPYYAEELRRRNQAKLGAKWHLDEVFLKIRGVQHYLWRAVDQNGAVIDIFVQPKRDGIAAERFSGGCFAVRDASRGSLSPTSSEVMALQNGPCFPMSFTGRVAT